MADRAAYQQWLEGAEKAKAIAADDTLELWQKAHRVGEAYGGLALEGLRSKHRHKILAAFGKVNAVFARYTLNSFDDYKKISEQDLPLSTSLGVLGLNGITAYFGLLEIGQPKSGETLVVSTAAGAVGSCVGQIANTLGCRTVGIAGGVNKKRLCLEEFGFDAAIDYKSEDVDAALAKACPDGVDVYFDNTAGPISDAVLKHLRLSARVVIART